MTHLFILLELGLLEGMKSLWLSDNNLVGSIPAALGNLNNFEEFAVGGNLLTGEVPSSLCAVDILHFDCSDELCGCNCTCDGGALRLYGAR